MTKDEALKLALEALGNTWTEPKSEQYKIEKEAITAIKEALAQTQEPVAWISTGTARMIHWTADKPAYGDDWVPLYITPPQRKPLTDEQIEEIAEGYLVDYRIPAGCAWNFARDIEAAHNILEQVDKNE